MSDPRMISAEDAQVTLDAIDQTGGHAFSFHDTYVRDLASTVLRLRRELEERIRIWQKIADKLEARGLVAEAEVARIHTTELTRILEGGNDE